MILPLQVLAYVCVWVTCVEGQIAVPLDHYIPQVHLKRFNSPSLNGCMYAIRKSDQLFFTPRAQDVCRVEEGSTNAYLSEKRAIEEFLRAIEPNYNRSVDKILANQIDQECIYTIAGFVAYVINCSPGGMRIHSELMKGMLQVQIAKLDAQGKLSLPPRELGQGTISDLIENGGLEITVDRKYPQAIGISQILIHTSAFGNFHWEILANEIEDSPFFTSDYPVAVEPSSHPRILNRVIPLAPNLAVKIKPQLGIDRSDVDFSFPSFRCRVRHLSRADVIKINRLLVRCAEDLVFFRDHKPWIANFINKNRKYHVKTLPEETNLSGGTYLLGVMKVVETGV